MGALKFALGANYKRFWKNIKVIAKREKKNAPLMFCDAAVSAFLFGSGLADYLNYEFYNRSFSERARYATVRTQDNFYEKVCPSAYKKTFTVKPNFHKTFSKYTKRDYLVPAESDAEGLKKFISSNARFVEKPVDGLGGHGVRKREASEIPDVDEYFRYLSDNRMFVEQYVVQHEKMSALCDRSVNTVRVMTSITSGEPKVIFAGLRVGNGNCDVDNFHGGGMGVLVDENTGVLIGEAIDKDLNKYDTHPSSGVKFDGYQLPCWSEIVEMVCEAAKIEPRIMVVGWDVAITPDGPIFIEGNRRPGFDLPQVVCKRGRKDIIETALKEIKERNR